MFIQVHVDTNEYCFLSGAAVLSVLLCTCMCEKCIVYRIWRAVYTHDI